MSSTNTALLTFIAGIAVGAALGVLLAPASGKETRQKLMKKSGEIRDKVADMVDDAKKMAGETINDATRAARETASQARSSTGYGSRNTGSTAGA
jgi:gas vesicle protein